MLEEEEYQLISEGEEEEAPYLDYDIPMTPCTPIEIEVIPKRTSPSGFFIIIMEIEIKEILVEPLIQQYHEYME